MATFGKKNALYSCSLDTINKIKKKKRSRSTVTTSDCKYYIDRIMSNLYVRFYLVF